MKKANSETIKYLGLVVPDAAAALCGQVGIVAALAAIIAIRMVPDFLFFGGDQRDGQTHPFGAPDAPDAMDVILFLIGHGHIHNWAKCRKSLIRQVNELFVDH